jgi:hypothetical protein
MTYDEFMTAAKEALKQLQERLDRRGGSKSIVWSCCPQKIPAEMKGPSGGLGPDPENLETRLPHGSRL